MNLDFSPVELAFRDEVRAFIEAELPEDIRARCLDGDDREVKSDLQRWQRILHARGWGACAWPVEYGGTGWSAVQRYLFETECALAGAPEQLPFGLKMVAPVLMRYGSAEQCAQHLPGILDGSVWWCQGYSEPGAGSDLARLKTRAVREGDHYVVDGQKAWNTYGQHADWMFCLVRTDSQAKPQQGISFLLIDMRTPGIRVQPTRLLDGGHEVNEVWFDSVRVPVANRVGEENAGWTYAKYLLAHERTNIAGIGLCQRELLRLIAMARSADALGRRPIDAPLLAARIAEVEFELKALELTNLRVVAEADRRHAPGPEASMLKVRGTEIRQRISELQVEVLGERGLLMPERGAGDADSPRATEAYLNLRKLSIYGGSNEIQRGIIAQQLLGL
jgi:alkylation response protein AidB-like acyl-CoA dehydrogenase